MQPQLTCTRLWPNCNIPGSGLLNLTTCTPAAVREGIPLGGATCWAGEGPPRAQLCRSGARHSPELPVPSHAFLQNYLWAVASLQPSNILPWVCIQLLGSSSVAKEAKPGLHWHMPAVGCNSSNQKSDTENLTKQLERDGIKLICFKSTKLFLSSKQGLGQSPLLRRV